MEKRGRETKISKRGWQTGSRGGCLKKGWGLETPYELWKLDSKLFLTFFFDYFSCKNSYIYGLM